MNWGCQVLFGRVLINQVLINQVLINQVLINQVCIVQEGSAYVVLISSSIALAALLLTGHCAL
ncbi:MAG: hypothetical protein ACRCUZ_03470 [Shewanella sp.]